MNASLFKQRRSIVNLHACVRARLHAGAVGCIALLIGLLTGGCATTIPAQYEGMEGQSIAAMAWADRSLRTDFPTVQFDVAAGVQNKLNQASTAMPELKGSTFPVRPEAISRYQEDYPQIEVMTIADVAPKLGVTRLVYIEVEQLRTRTTGSWDLFRGFMQGTVRVIEVADGKGKVVYEDRNVIAVFPRGTPEDGIPSGNDALFYRGVVNEFSTEIALRFFAHEDK